MHPILPSARAAARDGSRGSGGLSTRVSEGGQSTAARSAGGASTPAGDLSQRPSWGPGGGEEGGGPAGQQQQQQLSSGPPEAAQGVQPLTE
jgi:hypothetical protein